MKIQVMVGGAKAPQRYSGGAPVYALGMEIALSGRISNDGAADLTMQDPMTSQRALLWFRARINTQRIVFELTPPNMDATGEMTVPLTSDVTLTAGQSVDVPLRFWKHCADRCLVPGAYEVSFEHEGAVSDPLVLGVELTAESVPILIAVALDVSKERWSRGQAMLLLKRIPGGPALSPALPRESATEAAKREATNQQIADRFLQRWPSHSATAPVAKFFADQALKPEALKL